MRIPNDSSSRVAPPTVRTDIAASKVAAKAADASEARPAAHESVDKVNVSDKARRIAEEANAASSERVARLRQALDDGSFKVDFNKVASRIVDGS